MSSLEWPRLADKDYRGRPDRIAGYQPSLRRIGAPRYSPDGLEGRIAYLLVRREARARPGLDLDEALDATRVLSVKVWTDSNTSCFDCDFLSKDLATPRSPVLDCPGDASSPL